MSRILLAVVLACAPGLVTLAADKPNIVLIMADDIGYGDLGCYGATKVKTPNLDKLAGQGLRFTDAHATSGTCTPSRYSLMTGQYAWRKRGTGILPGDANLIIDYKRPTLPNTLKAAGYATGAVGKWHLGLGEEKIDWNKELSPGPNEVGFDYAFVIPATVDRVPCVFVENHRIAKLDPADPITVSYQYKVGNEPTGKENPDQLKMKLTHGHDATIVNGISRIGWMSGGKAARWVDEDIADTLAGRATKFIEEHANKAQPFFLYYATHDVHVPRAPHARFAGTSQAGTRGDSVHQLDWQVGRVMETLERLRIADNTLVLFTSDNGPVLDDGYDDTAKLKEGHAANLPLVDRFGHTPGGPLRGQKYSPYEAGTRVPLIARWPGRVKAGQTSGALVCQVDLLHSFAAMTGQALAGGAAPDSSNVLPALLGEVQFGRESLVEQGGPLAIRVGNWKCIPGGPAGNINAPNPAAARPAGAPKPQLYDLSADLAEQNNLAEQQPERVKAMTEELVRIRQQGGSRAGL